MIALTETEMRDRVSKAAQRAGGQSKLAAKHGLSVSYVNDMLLGRKPVSVRLAQELGYERCIAFRKTRRKNGK